VVTHDSLLEEIMKVKIIIVYGDLCTSATEYLIPLLEVDTRRIYPVCLLFSVLISRIIHQGWIVLAVEAFLFLLNIISQQ
jgi:hypothetical protein